MNPKPLNWVMRHTSQIIPSLLNHSHHLSPQQVRRPYPCVLVSTLIDLSLFADTLGPSKFSNQSSRSNQPTDVGQGTPSQLHQLPSISLTPGVPEMSENDSQDNIPNLIHRLSRALAGVHVQDTGIASSAPPSYDGFSR